MTDERQNDEFIQVLAKRIATLRQQLASAERHYAEETGTEFRASVELRYTHIHELNEAMEAALRRIGPAKPEELLRELESGTWGFRPDDNEKTRLANMGRAYKQGGRKKIEFVDGQYRLSTSQPK